MVEEKPASPSHQLKVTSGKSLNVVEEIFTEVAPKNPLNYSMTSTASPPSRKDSIMSSISFT
jgi:hypothetical protein